MEKNIVVSELNEELITALKKREEEGAKLLQIKETNSPEEVVRKLHDYIDTLQASNCSEKELEEYAFKLGSVWGRMVEKEYGWSWKYFEHKNQELSGTYMVSPQSYFCCSPLSFMYDVLAGNKKSLSGDKDNTVVLLFNTIDGIDKRRSDSRKYVLLS